MALTSVQQRLILNATLNLDAASQKKIEESFGEGLVKKLMDAAESGGEEFAAGIEGAFNRVQAAQSNLNSELNTAATKMAEAAKYAEEAVATEALVVEARRKIAEATAAGDVAAAAAANVERIAAETNLKAAETNRDTAQAAASAAATANRDRIKAARAELAMQIRSAKNFEAMYDAANAVRTEQIEKEEDIYKYAGERMGRKAQGSGSVGLAARDMAKVMQHVVGIFESPNLETVLEGVKSATVSGLKRVEMYTKDSKNLLGKTVNYLAKTARQAGEGYGDLFPTSLLDILRQLARLFIKLYDTRANLTRGFAESTPTLLQKDQQTGLGATRTVAMATGVTYSEAAQMVGEAWAENTEEDLVMLATTAKGLGISVGEVASQTQKLKSNFKQTGDIFGETAHLAQAAGLSMQSAYGILQSVTSGMSFMNAGLKQSIGFIKKLVVTFGEELGQQLAQSLGIVRGMTPQDAMKELMLMTAADRNRIFQLALTDTDRSTPQGEAAARMLGRAARGSIMEQAVALRHIGPRAELYMEGARGSALFGKQTPDQMSPIALMAKATLGMTSADTEVRQLALSIAGLDDGVGHLNGSIKEISGHVAEIQKTMRTLDDNIQRLVDYTATLAPGMDGLRTVMADLTSVIKSMFNGGAEKRLEDIAKRGAANDFIYRGNGTSGSLTPINSRDQFFGAMPGGPIDTAMRAAGVSNGIRGGTIGGRGGVAAGPSHVTVNINGGDLGKVYEVVRNVLRQSGIRPSAGAYAG